MRLLDRLLTLPTAGKVLVMHIRGSTGDPQGEAVHSICRTVIQDRCSRYQRVHVHCCQTSAGQVAAWRAAFEHAYFGFTAVVNTYGDEQMRAL